MPALIRKIGLAVAFKIAFPNDLHPFHVALYGFLALPAVRLDMGSTYQGTPEFGSDDWE